MLSTNGDGTGTTSAIGNYASTAETFELVAGPASPSLVVRRMLVTVRDSGAFDAELYGNGVELPNGLTLHVADADDVLLYSLTPTPIVRNADWTSVCYDAQILTWGIGDEFLAVRWTFAKSMHDSEGGIVLEAGDKLVLTANDDLTSLIDHTFTCEGYALAS